VRSPGDYSRKINKLILEYQHAKKKEKRRMSEHFKFILQNLTKTQKTASPGFDKLIFVVKETRQRARLHNTDSLKNNGKMC
jgi:hypothetical protein